MIKASISVHVLKCNNYSGVIMIISKVKRFNTRVKNRIKLEYLKRRWAHNYSPYSFDIDWGSYNYNRISIINLLFSNQVDGKYLEVGCQGNVAFDSIIAKSKVGVDPVKGGTVRLTSDQYFSNNEEKFDVIFLDGLHTYEQIRLDIRNAAKSLKNGRGWIVLHDMLPRNWLEAHVPRISKKWTGDVWKIAFELKQAANIDFKIIRIDHGVGVLKISDSRLVSIPDLHSSLKGKNYNYFYQNINSLPVVEYKDGRDWICSYLA